jgi:crotonobetainyl-CoA:carnitine CoA-transferase CaiB-like acyl-CoA transferase
MRIIVPHIQDYSNIHCDLNWGKWNCFLDFRKEKDLEKAKELIKGADVVVIGYRPGVLDKYGLGEERVIKLW